MPRNICRSWSMNPRTRPAVVRTTGPPPAACASGEMQVLIATLSRSRRLKVELRFRIGQRPVLYQLRPRGGIDASHAAHSETMSTTVEHVQLAAHPGGA